MSGYAWVTLATNDSYSLGALVLAHSLRRANTVHQLAILITPGVSEAMRTQLSAVYNLVKVVDVLDSKDEANLTLLARPELGITFTKLHCWRLTQFSKCVFLDADTLVLQNCDELFEREELSAAPDAGWPDCFNSGVFVFGPSNDTFNKLMEFAVVHGSFDGGDQGLLNLYYNDWATRDISKHLPFIYNMCSTATYSYLPAFKQFGENLKIIHFIGSSKPWLQVFDTETGLARVSGESHSIGSFIQLWWDLFCTYVHKSLSTEMDSEELLVQTQHRLSSCYAFTSSSTSTSAHYPDPSFSSPPRSNTRIRSPPPYIEPVNDYDMSLYVFTDPWDEFNEIVSDVNSQQNYDSFNAYSDVYNEINDHSVHSCHSNINYHQTDCNHGCENNNNFVNNNHNRNPDTFSEPVVVDWHDNKSNDSNLSGGGNYELWNRPTKRDSFLQPERRISVPSITEAPSQYQLACPSISAPSLSPSMSSVGLCQEETQEIHPQNEPNPDPDGGLAGALATITLGSPLSPEQTALQDHLRRQGWEQGQIDYMGRDSFDNIWKKISETINAIESTSPQVQSSAVPISQDTVSESTEPLTPEKPKEQIPPSTRIPAAFETLSAVSPSIVSTSATPEPTPTSPPVVTAAVLPQTVTSTVATPEPVPTSPPVVTAAGLKETVSSLPVTPLSPPQETTSTIPSSVDAQITPSEPSPIPLAHPESPPLTLTEVKSPLSPSLKQPTQPSSLTPPASPKTEDQPTKPVQPSTPTVTSPTPPTSPPIDPFEAPLPAKLNVDTETPGTPPAGISTGSTDEPPIPPKRKGVKVAQEQASKIQPKGGKPAKGKK